MVDDAEFEARAARARGVSDSYGQGWMSRLARDMVIVAAFAGFDLYELTLRLARLKLQVVQERHVLAAMHTLSEAT